MSFIDNLWTIKIIGMLVTPFDQTQAFKLGIIDAKGTYLKKSRDLRTQEEKSAFDMMDRMIFSLKKLINMTPGGESKLKSLTAAYFLIKESMDNLNEEASSLDLDSVTEDQMAFVQSILEDMATVGPSTPTTPDTTTMPSNRTGKSVSTDEPVIKSKKNKNYKFVKRNK